MAKLGRNDLVESDGKQATVLLPKGSLPEMEAIMEGYRFFVTVEHAPGNKVTINAEPEDANVDGKSFTVFGEYDLEDPEDGAFFHNMLKNILVQYLAENLEGEQYAS